MRFGKYHGLGNDFIIVDLRTAPDAPAAQAIQRPAIVRALCDRRRGIGGDGILAVLPAADPVHARMRILNADGSEAEMCGNGLRCVVKHLYERDPELRERAHLSASGGSARPRLVIDTGAGALTCEIERSADGVDSVTVDMGRPQLNRGDIPMTGPAGERCIEVPVTVAEHALALTAVSMGNPHAVVFTDASGQALHDQAAALGPRLESHPWFPQRTNVEFVHARGPAEFELVVWERGCGITQACGTGACATVVAACLTGRAVSGAEVAVHLPGGTLDISVDSQLQTVSMRGPAVHVFDGHIPDAKLA
ncbi:diaminopimelate epimerase [Haliangium sp.]|uniref:diaminopimelate epimerase n=1 Tax=Haliangium sp. TaxID=2663208 RepID=UPI003D1327EB